MIGFVAYRWRAGEPLADNTAERLRRTALDRQWQLLVDAPGWTVIVEPAPCISSVHIADGEDVIVVGRIFDRAATERGSVAPGILPDGMSGFAAVCDHLTTQCWGSYVALRVDPDDPSVLAIFRDPIGMLDCTTWPCGTLRVIASEPEPFLGEAPPADVAIDWLRVAGLLRFPGSVGDALPVIGVDAVAPGTCQTFTAGHRQSTRIWAPADIARRRAPTIPPTLPSLIDACIRAWRSCSETAIAEVSGGLDSAIVAASLARSEPGIAGWFHYYAADREGDERVFARATAEHLRLSLHETLCDSRTIDAVLMADVPVTLRPNVGSISFFHDRDLASRGRALGADSLFTGQGGDALFFQPATPLIAVDLWRDPRSWAAKRGCIASIAAWTGRSIWSVLGTTLRQRIAPTAIVLPDYRTDLVARDMPSDPCPLPWLDGTADLAPAKQLQILNLAACRAAFGGSWCATTMTVIHPLMSQPLLEHVLPIPALDLTQGRRDRAMIREAYANRLPPTLIERRGKGCQTPFFGRMLAGSTPFLRDYLLGGVLDQHLVLDRASVEAVLDPDHLMQTNSYTEIFVVLLMEHWARAWHDRFASINTTRR